jgi:hypothetical protein
MHHLGLAHAVHALPLLLVAGLLGGRGVRALPAWAAGNRTAHRQALLAAVLLAAAVVHVQAGFLHAGALRALLLGCAAAQAALAVAVLRAPSRRTHLAVLGLSVAALVAWEVSRTVGLPFGLEPVEPVGWADLLSALCELAAVLLAARQLHATVASRRPTAEQLAWGLIVAAATSALVSL